MKPQRLPPAPDLEWRGAIPRTRGPSGDSYFSAGGGLAEAQAVFLAGCGLPAAWAGGRAFTIFELGFGAGLNALAAWRLWAATRPPGAILHFCSVEAAPMAASDAARALSAFPEISSFAERLLATWPVRARAPQRLWFEAEGFALTLWVGEAAQALRGFQGVADAWFLDGFAPDRNPEMWSAELMRLVAARSAPGARLATYSVAGAVRRNLEAAGFSVAKKPGFAAKRERLEAHLDAKPDARAGMFPYAPCSGRVAIVGGGIAGAALAHALARRGRDCLLLDDAVAAPGPAALVMPQFDRGGGVHGEWRLAAYLAATRLYGMFGALHACGAEEEVREAAGFADLCADPPLPPDWLAAADGRLLHRRAGIVRPAELLAALTHGVPRRVAQIARIARAGDRWRLLNSAGAEIAAAEAVALCCGARLGAFAETNWLPLRLSRGQLEWAPAPSIEVARAGRSYVAPAPGGMVFGATFDKAVTADSPIPDEASRRRNIAALARLAPEIAAKLGDGERMVSHAALRAALPDYAPVVGLLPDAPAWRAQYASLAHGRIDRSGTPPSLHGLYVLGGLSARGFTLAPLLAERLAAEINGEPPPLSRAALDALHPARFLKRALKRNE